MQNKLKNIVLIGMPASGKTTIGKLLAKNLNKEHIDADIYLEKKENKKISNIFSEYGEDFFRELEKKYLKEISEKENVVISTGGGVVKKYENIEILKKNGVIIFLDRKVEDIMKEDHKDRPLLQDIKNVEKLYSERINLYKEYSDYIIENDSTLKNVVEKIINILEV